MDLEALNLVYNFQDVYAIFLGKKYANLFRSATFHFVTLMLLKLVGLTRINLEAEAKGIDEETASGQPYHYESIEEYKP